MEFKFNIEHIYQSTVCQVMRFLDGGNATRMRMYITPSKHYAILIFVYYLLL